MKSDKSCLTYATPRSILLINSRELELGNLLSILCNSIDLFDK